MSETQRPIRGKYDLGKVDYNGSGRKSCRAVLTWELTADGRFSMQGEVWNPRETNIYCGGQCVDTIAAFRPYDKKAQRMVEVWRRWHLNDMRAGCEHQRAEGWADRAIDETQPTDRYVTLTVFDNAGDPVRFQGWNMLCWLPASQRTADGRAGLLSAPCQTCGYKYGTAWLREELPVDIIAEIHSWETA